MPAAATAAGSNSGATERSPPAIETRPKPPASLQVTVEVVAGEQFVAAQAGKYHVDVLPDEAMQQV